MRQPAGWNKSVRVLANSGFMLSALTRSESFLDLTAFPCHVTWAVMESVLFGPLVMMDDTTQRSMVKDHTFALFNFWTLP